MDTKSIQTIGDLTQDTILEIDESQAELLCDIRHQSCEIALKYGEKIPVKELSVGCGGSALNTAVGFSRLGLKTTISGIVGDDLIADEIIQFLKEGEINTSQIKRQGQTNRSSIILYKKERTILSYHGPRDYRGLGLTKSDWIYFASANKGIEALNRKVLEQVSRGVKLAINPGSWELKNFEIFLPLARVATALILNKSEAELITGENKIANQLKKMLSLGTKIAVITDGRNGAYFALGNENYHIGIAPSDLLDSTGAGDSFSAGFIGGLIMTSSLEQSAKWGMVNSASVVESLGANKGLLSRSEIENRANKLKSLKIAQI
ncbi:MAG: carbohydrate kinase family protein [Candidatus Berkelbacteria bacterium]|nr:carbohydrate kinase family protein [Candidatus Berkelbacteria bacterium]